MRPSALPLVTRGDLILDGCVRVQVVHESPVAQVMYWRCLCDGEALRSERCHTHHVLTLTIDGSSHLHDGRRRFVVDPAGVMFHAPGSAYRTTHPNGCNDSGFSIAYRPDVIDDAAGRLGLADHDRDPAARLCARPMKLALRQLVLTLRARDGLATEPVLMDELALDILRSALVGRRGFVRARRAGTTAEHRHLVEETRAYLNANLREPVRLHAVAHAVGTSPFHLARVFKRHTGLTIHAYLRRLRLGAAVGSLADSATPLTRVALDAGYSSHSHLTTHVAEELGTTPSELRRLLRAPRPGDIVTSALFSN